MADEAVAAAAATDWRAFRTSPPPTCDATNFTLDLGNTHCPELDPAGDAKSPDECMKACCAAADSCETWQWCAAGEACESGYWFEAGALSAGGDLDGWPRNTTLAEAQEACTSSGECRGITYHSQAKTPTGTLKIWLKNDQSGRTGDTTWSRQLKARAGCFLGKLHRACANATSGWTSRAKPPPPTTRRFVSAVFGSHMVLQRAPQRALVWGHSTPGATVSVSLDGVALLPPAKADANGTWRQRLPATPASTTPHVITMVGSAEGERATLSDVLFGDVWVCGGQSNMVYAMGYVTNASAEIARADKYPSIRLFTVGQGTSSEYPLADLQTVEQPWTIASNASIAGNGIFVSARVHTSAHDCT